MRDADVLWVNDAHLGRWTLLPGQPALHDVTDDWRATVSTERVRNRLIAGKTGLPRESPLSSVAMSSLTAGDRGMRSRRS